MGKLRERKKKSHSRSQNILELRLEFQTAICLYGNPLLQETVDASIVAFIWRIHAAGKKRTSFG